MHSSTLPRSLVVSLHLLVRLLACPRRCRFASSLPCTRVFIFPALLSLFCAHPSRLLLLFFALSPLVSFSLASWPQANNCPRHSLSIGAPARLRHSCPQRCLSLTCASQCSVVSPRRIAPLFPSLSCLCRGPLAADLISTPWGPLPLSVSVGTLEFCARIPRSPG